MPPIPDVDAPRVEISSDNGIRADDGTFADCDSGKHDRVGADDAEPTEGDRGSAGIPKI